MKLPSHLIRVGTTYHYRQRVPKELVVFFGKKYVKQSLRTGDTARAKELAYSFAHHYQERFKEMSEEKRLQEAKDWLDKLYKKQPEENTQPTPEPEAPTTIRKFEIEQLGNGWGVKQADGTEDYKLALSEIDRRKAEGLMPVQAQAPQQQQTATQPQGAEMLLSKAIEWFKKKLQQQSFNPATLAKYIKNLQEFLEFHNDGLVGAIQGHHIDRFRQHLEQKQKNSAATVRNKLSALSRLFEELEKSGLYSGKNPAKGQVAIKLKQKISRIKTHGRLKFSEDEIRKIFTGLEESSKRPTQFFCPLIQLYTGARINEVCQLQIDDFVKDEGLFCISINDDGENSSLKNAHSKRLVPIHPKLEASGLLDYVQALKQEKMPNSRIFPYLTYTKNRFGGYQTQQFSRYLDKLGIDRMGGRKGTHSFRKTVVQKFQDHQISKEVRKDYVGHITEDRFEEFYDSHSMSYSRISRTSELAKICHPALDFDLGCSPKADIEKFIKYCLDRRG